MVVLVVVVGAVLSGLVAYGLYTGTLPSPRGAHPTPISSMPSHNRSPKPLSEEERNRALHLALDNTVTRKVLENNDGNYTVLYVVPVDLRIPELKNHRLAVIHLDFNRSTWVEGDFYAGIHGRDKYVHKKLWVQSLEVLVDLDTGKVYVDAGPGLPGGHVSTPEFTEAMPIFDQYLRQIGVDEVRDIVLLGVYYDGCDKGMVLARAEVTMDGRTKYYLMAADLCRHSIVENATGKLIVLPGTPLWS